MKKYIAYLFITVILVILSGCTSHDSNGENGHEQRQRQTILPFNDGVFILSLSDFDEGWFVGFTYSEGRQEWSDRFRGIGWFRFYQATNFLSYTSDFIDIMNNLSPVLVDSIAIERFDDPPFEGIAFDDFLYSFQLNEVPNWACAYEMDKFNEFSIRMRVHETGEYGFLHFVLWGRKTILLLVNTISTQEQQRSMRIQNLSLYTI